jgi:lactate/malate dehydrogenase, NAD binding domain
VIRRFSGGEEQGTVPTVLKMASALLTVGREALRGLGSRAMATATQTGYKVAVLGAAGGIGQPLSLLMKVRVQLSRDRR